VARAADLRRRLVDALAIEDDAVRAAFAAVPRERFLPGRPPEEVYRDEAIVTKRDERGLPISSSSQPAIMARMLERLALEPGLRVLEIGAGTGYNAALLKTLVGPQGRVVSVDVDPELAREARRALDGYAVRVVTGDGRAGWEPGAPYDRIVATVATGEVPAAWRDQLVEGGLLELPLVLPRGEQVVATFRRAGARLRSVALVPGGFMQLRGTEPYRAPTLHAGGPSGPLVQLSGEAIGRLSNGARRRLLAVALDPPRRVTVPPATRWLLRLHLALALPAARVVESPRVGLGVVGRGGRSLALADTSWERHGRPTRHLLAYGDREAEEYLRRTIELLPSGPPELRVEWDGDRSRIVRG
jgi:protein-L-isoaspartate(D-aspartate) O-methyltransferase